jgi:hypothetical protein
MHCIKFSRQIHILVALQTGFTLDGVKTDEVQIGLEHGNKQKNPSLSRNWITTLSYSSDSKSLYWVRYNGVCMLNKEFNGTKTLVFDMIFEASNVVNLFIIYLISINSSDFRALSVTVNKELWIRKLLEGIGLDIFFQVLTISTKTYQCYLYPGLNQNVPNIKQKFWPHCGNLRFAAT